MEKLLSLETDAFQTDVNQKYWDEKWRNQEIGWDIGYSSPAIEKYLRQYQDKNTNILIPGCGNAYEAEYLWNLGFRNISVLDFAPNAVKNLENKFKEKEGISVICEDFFEHEGNYDLVIEQTFFCAIPTLRRNEYAKKMHDLLSDHGRIVGVMFNRTFAKKGPPFGGSLSEYYLIFKKYFEIKKMEDCDNSIEARQGSELFINLQKK